MILNRQNVKVVEKHLYHHLEDIRAYDELRQDIAESCCYKLDPTGIRSTGGDNDPTMQKTAQLEKEAAVLKAWINVVKDVLRKYELTLYADFISMVFFERLNQIKVCDLLYISRSTFFNWKEEIINYTAMLAFKENLIIL